MNVLVIGAGGREHAICLKFLNSSKVRVVYCVPGNGGISRNVECVNIPITDFKSIVTFVKEKKVDLTFVGQEVPLSLGIVDYFHMHNLKIIGPSKKATLLESSKIYSKNFMTKYGIPTANYKCFTNITDAINFLENYPKNKKIVIKADGLAAGKGVYICSNSHDGVRIVKKMMYEHSLGDAGNKLIIEEYIYGREFSYLLFIDGKSYALMPIAKDYKKLNDNDQGLNTGGMGSFAPIPNTVLPDDLNKKIIQLIVNKTVNGIIKENLNYKGVLYIGVIVSYDSNQPYVLEFNCRLGDPETQVILPLLNTDLLDISNAIINGTLAQLYIEWKKQYATCVVLASEGYPNESIINIEITGLKDIDVENYKDVFIFHSGTKYINNRFITAGGRVLGITSLDDNLQSATAKTYNILNAIYFQGMHYRKDIGKI
ncbi:MAG: phosphoribosylamine--glycine ligase [Endomicrobium sp.]|jgi:phosphoribosylamine--glycine ligase|nr:phosphoribosylamine--glycine ligase [Endomicrobium sp.]